tara:strand:- start:478 stop:876 length:399 start_codon:yes stop_codon:yes gene_type:complete
MGTRSNTIIYDDDVHILNLYRQGDGYLSGHGSELLEFLEPLKMVNGYSIGEPNQANGAGCLAAQMVAHFKVGVGGFYIQPPMGELENDYTYTIKVDRQLGGGNISITVHAYEDQVFEGSVESFKEFIAEEVK